MLCLATAKTFWVSPLRGESLSLRLVRRGTQKYPAYAGKSHAKASRLFFQRKYPLGVGNSELIYQLPAISSHGDQGKARVTIHEFVQNHLMAPSVKEVPTVPDRQAWLKAVGRDLKRRKTVTA